ncbi:hypothetical protein [Streptomyces phaeochromogenes]|uniref:hypothetical protein n=1 Tax=Streptomyces phaeochromogenes TaxID=1923 RepID=UPI0036A0D085
MRRCHPARYNERETLRSTFGRTEVPGCQNVASVRFTPSMPFVYYRILLGILIIVLVSMGALSPHVAESAG